MAWFKPNAAEPIRRVWDLVALLREANVPGRLSTAARPGRIVSAHRDRWSPHRRGESGEQQTFEWRPGLRGRLRREKWPQFPRVGDRLRVVVVAADLGARTVAVEAVADA